MMDKKKFEEMSKDPNFTLEVQNPEVEELLVEYSNDRSAENLNKLINKITKCRFLVPANVDENRQPLPMIIKNSQGESFLPLYTSKEQLPKDKVAPAVVNMPYLAINNMASKKESKLDGVVFNPFTNNLIFKRPLVEKIETVEKARREGKKGKTVQMTEQQYVVFERIQFEHVFLPDKMFENGQEFIDKLSEEKEMYIDQLYEESYQQKRMYPYMDEDFSVMVMQISDDLTMVSVDFPTRDMAPGCSQRAYLIWDKVRNTGKYFSRDVTRDKDIELIEIRADHSRVSHGQAPVEGAELQTIIDLINDTDNLN